MASNSKICRTCGIRKAGIGKTRVSIRSGEKVRYYKKCCNTCSKYPNLEDKAKQVVCDGCHSEYHPVCLDVDHVNGDSSDDRYENYQILCANCHRLKTYLNKEHINKDKR